MLKKLLATTIGGLLAVLFGLRTGPGDVRLQ